LEIHFGVNYLSHFLIIRRLMENDVFASSEDPRIVFVTSSLLKSGLLDLGFDKFGWESRRKGKGMAPVGYCDSKLMQALHCQVTKASF